MLTLLAGLSCALWLYLLLGRAWFWRANQRLDPSVPPPESAPPVVAIIPARDEADTIAACLESLLEQDYPGDLGIVLVDDNSADATAAIGRRIAATNRGRLGVIAGSAPPAGWSGKLWALAQGVEEAIRVDQDTAYYWFTDADIRHGPHTLSALMAKARFDNRDLVSLMARLRCQGFWERLLVPALVFFFQKLYPFAWINDPHRATAGAAGGCILLRREALERAGGLSTIRAALIDDCALARAVQGSGGRLWLGLADATHSLRGYPTLAEFWHMVTRTAFAQLDHSPWMLLATVVGMGVSYLTPPLILLTLPWHDDGTAGGLAAGACLGMATAYLPTVFYYRQAAVTVILLPFAAALYSAMTLDSARRHWFGRGAGWKGRHYARNQQT